MERLKTNYLKDKEVGGSLRFTTQSFRRFKNIANMFQVQNLDIPEMG
jgi:hypothetical protein